MKKIIPLLVLTIFFSLNTVSCSNDDNPQPVNTVDKDTIAEVHELVNPVFTANSIYSYQYRLNFRLDYDSDQLLIYRQVDTTTSGSPVWVLLPSSFTNDSGTITHSFDFSKEDFTIYMDANYDIKTLTPNFLTNQVFRIVIIPGFFPSTKSTTPAVDYNDYASVIKYYNIDESKMKNISTSTEVSK
ncbi:hypothetical protein O2K51_11515 [Apibacter raozihei]|uniref:hypothetical protein n=1 Tax=Apibacter TaxID=1778601 RepID=UPI000FE3CF84|nr:MULTISPECIES: hypothetical protein [Apibacter]